MKPLKNTEKLRVLPKNKWQILFYEHMEFKNLDGEYMKTMINASLNNLLNEKDVDFIERDELIKIIKRLK